MIWNDNDGFLKEIKDHSKYGIFLDMGVGKTSLLLALINYKLLFTNVEKILIIAPKKVSLSTWQNEIKKWENFRHLKDEVILIDGTEQERIRKLKENKKINIISSSLVEWLIVEKKKIEYKTRSGEYRTRNVYQETEFLPKFDLVIIDECSQFKDITTNRFKALQRMFKDKDIDLYLLSGTPFPNINKESHKTRDGRLFEYYKKSEEFYYVLNLFGLYNGSLTDFRNEFCYSDPWDRFNYKMTKQNYDKIMDVISKVSISKRLELDVAVNYHKVYCKTSESEMRELIHEYQVETNNYTDITAANRAVMINKTLQLSNGFLYDGVGDVHRINTFKLEKTLELLEQLKERNVMILYVFKEDEELLLKHIPNLKKFETVQDEKDWNEGKISRLLVSPFADKFGLNIQEGGYTMIWFGLVWSAEAVSQTIARLARRGQTKDVDVYFLLSEYGFDSYVYDVVVSKIQTTNDFKSYVQMF